MYSLIQSFFFFNQPPTTDIATLSLHDALPISTVLEARGARVVHHYQIFRDGTLVAEARSTLACVNRDGRPRSEEHTSELQSHSDLVCRLLLEKEERTSYAVAIQGLLYWTVEGR